MAKKLNNGEARPTHEQIAQRARAIYEQSGRTPGRDLENWLQAESQLRAADKPATESRPEPRQELRAETRAPMRELSKPSTRQ